MNTSETELTPPQETLLAISLKHLPTASKVIELRNEFPDYFQPFISAIEFQLQHNETLTRDSLTGWLELNGTRVPAEIVGYKRHFSKLNMIPAKPADAPIVIKELLETTRHNKQTNAVGQFLKDRDEQKLIENIINSTPKIEQKQSAFPFDFNKLPHQLCNGVRGIAALNPKLSASSQILVPFAYAGTVIGKNKKVKNLSALYYPNLWIMMMADSGQNKSATLSLLQDKLAFKNMVGDSPTMEALIEEMGFYIKTNGIKKEDIFDQIENYRTECQKDLTGKILIADEITDTLRRLAGGIAEENMGNLLNLATSGKMIQQRRTTTSSIRIACDLCLSIFGFTQQQSWDETFGDEKYQNKGFIGRFIPCNGKMPLLNLGLADKKHWDAFIFATNGLCEKKEENPFTSYQNDEPVEPKEVEEIGEWVDTQIPFIQALPVFRALTGTIGSYIEKLFGKIIAHAIKLSLICELYEGNLKDHFLNCAELVTSLFYHYFSDAYGAKTLLTTSEQKALTFIGQNQGCSLRDITRKFNLKDAKSTWELLGRLQETMMIVAKEGHRGKWTFSTCQATCHNNCHN